MRDIYISAWRQEIKGITILEYHFKTKQVLEKAITNDIKACKVYVQ